MSDSTNSCRSAVGMSDGDGLRTRATKVFGIGFHKTGTKTLGEALSLLGYRVVEGGGKALLPHIKKNDLGPVWEMVARYDAFKDNPWPLLYRELDERYPGSKFILTYRDDEKWLNSTVKYFGEERTEMREWIYGTGAPRGHEEVYLERYRRHNEEVRRYFGSRDDFIELCWESGHGWQELCRYLGLSVPDMAFPHANKGSGGIRERFAAAARRLMGRSR